MSSDFCVLCDEKLSDYCASCVDVIRKERDEARKSFVRQTERLIETEEEVERLRAELAKHQASKFHPDWSLLQTCRESLDEARAAIEHIAQQQREACAKAIECTIDTPDWAERAAAMVRHMPLVTEERVMSKSEQRRLAVQTKKD
jgi:hypothetical protein